MKGSLLSRYSHEVLAGRIRSRSPTSGEKYLRKKEVISKNEARRAVLDLFTIGQFPKGLTILTMPSIRWSFERSLLQARESRNIFNKARRPHRTYICSIERDEGIYRTALTTMPGIEHGLIQLDAPSYATTAYRTYYITRFYRCTFEDLADMSDFVHDAAWLDFNGPITLHRLEKIRNFWQYRLKKRLVITSLRARYDIETTDILKKCGGLSNLLLKALDNSKLIHEMEYMDTSPMIQLGLDKI